MKRKRFPLDAILSSTFTTANHRGLIVAVSQCAVEQLLGLIGSGASHHSHRGLVQKHAGQCALQ